MIQDLIICDLLHFLRVTFSQGIAIGLEENLLLNPDCYLECLAQPMLKQSISFTD